MERATRCITGAHGQVGVTIEGPVSKGKDVVTPRNFPATSRRKL